MNTTTTIKSIDRFCRQGQFNTIDNISINRCWFEDRILWRLSINTHRFEHKVMQDLYQAALDSPRGLISIFELHEYGTRRSFRTDKENHAR